MCILRAKRVRLTKGAFMGARYDRAATWIALREKHIYGTIWTWINLTTGYSLNILLRARAFVQCVDLPALKRNKAVGRVVINTTNIVHVTPKLKNFIVKFVGLWLNIEVNWTLTMWMAITTTMIHLIYKPCAPIVIGLKRKKIKIGKAKKLNTSIPIRVGLCQNFTVNFRQKK